MTITCSTAEIGRGGFTTGAGACAHAIALAATPTTNRRILFNIAPPWVARHGLTSRAACASSFSNVPASEKILVAMSGGVDSSVAALLLKQQGHEIVGAYMKNWINEDNVVGHCPWMQDIDDARAVCDRLGIEFRVVNLMREYRERVVAYPRVCTCGACVGATWR